MAKTVVVTRHAALMAYLGENGLAPEGSEVIGHANREDIEGCHVVGMLPYHLSCYAKDITIVPISSPLGVRGKELSLSELYEYAGPAETYRVEKIS